MPHSKPYAVVKIGGSLAAEPDALAGLWRGVKGLSASHHVVVVHGAGPQMTVHAREMDHEPRVVAGRRVTGDLDLTIAARVLAGEVNAHLTASALGAGVRAVGLSALAGRTVVATRRAPAELDGETIDFGHVGDIASVDAELVQALAGARFVPILSSLCADADGNLLNINADTVAGALAYTLDADRLLLVTETGGVRARADDPASRVPVLNRAAFQAGVSAGWIGGGMRVKGEVGFGALDQGVASVVVCAPADLARPDNGTRLAG
jgi:acetylglutamate kinase